MLGNPMCNRWAPAATPRLISDADLNKISPQVKSSIKSSPYGKSEPRKLDPKERKNANDFQDRWLKRTKGIPHGLTNS